jgi:hypothetical protein
MLNSRASESGPVPEKLSLAEVLRQSLASGIVLIDGERMHRLQCGRLP